MTDLIQQSGKTLAVTIERQVSERADAYMRRGNELQTREVSSPEAKDVVWSLEIKADGRWGNEKRNQLYGEIDLDCKVICRMEEVLTMVRADYSIYLIGDGGEREEVATCKDWNFIKPSDGGWASKREWISDFDNVVLGASTWTVVAEISFTPPVSITDRLQWDSKFSKLHGDQASSDCVIKIGNATLPVHKFPLMAHSPVFRVMFTSPMAEESKSNVVEISDFHPEPVHAMVRYCYEAHIDAATLDGEWGEEVFQLADKYDIDQLKAHIEKHFEKKLTAENVLKMAMLADSHSAPRLRKACVKLFTRERKAICATAGWDELKRVRPELADDLVKEASVKTGGIGMKRSLVL